MSADSQQLQEQRTHSLRPLSLILSDTLNLTTDKSSVIVSADSQQMQVLANIHKGAHTLFYTITTLFI